MAEAKTVVTRIEPADFISQVGPERKREEAQVLDQIFRDATGEKPQMWGPSIIGYGSYQYRYESGHGGTMCRQGFSPRKAKHSLYVLRCGDETEAAAFAPLLAKLGKHSMGKACLYVNKLDDIDLEVLEEMIRLAWKRSCDSFPE
ncbi:DUF1801 domain-containing protein [Qipengyuania sp. RANM35]|uniref:DUF1801 domain-containing protein n=1 Tax=Qipengyuania sp. RANM35 TaxID=3068635 RepID=UPI0034DB4322